MRNLLKIAGIGLLFSTSTIYAQTYLESNKEDVRCEWTSKNDSGKGLCHIIAQGTQMGETITSFRIENRPEVITISDKEDPTISLQKGEDWKIIWKGKMLKNTWKTLPKFHAIETIKLSNGYEIKLYR